MPVRTKTLPGANEEWVHDVQRGVIMECCDCGCVHNVDFKIKGETLAMRAKLMAKETVKIRRRKKIVVVRLS